MEVIWDAEKALIAFSTIRAARGCVCRAIQNPRQALRGADIQAGRGMAREMHIARNIAYRVSEDITAEKRPRYQ